MGLVLVFSELLVNDGGDDHIFCTLKIENKFVCFPMEEHHNISSWTLLFMRTALTVCSGICPRNNCDLGFSSDGRHGFNELK